MDSPSLLARGQQRGREMALPYAGALLPQEAHAVLRADCGAVLIDVRTRAELDWVGRIPEAAHIEWNTYPGGLRNQAFIEKLRALVSATDVPLLFICRSGGRSDGAAALAAQAGYTQAYNVLEGFEGDKDANGHRGMVGGWKVAGLPWAQG